MVNELIALVEVGETRYIKDAKLEFFPPPAIWVIARSSFEIIDKTDCIYYQTIEGTVNNSHLRFKSTPEIGAAFTIFFDASIV
jgi:hypothetical protein